MTPNFSKTAPALGPHELPANPIHSSHGSLALGTAFTAGYKLPSARAITRSIAVHIALFLELGRNADRRDFIVAMSVDRLRWFSDWWHDVGEVLIVSGVRINAQSSKLDG